MKTSNHQEHEEWHSTSEFSDQHDAVGREIVDAAMEVHRTLGPGLLESVYELCLQHELTKCGLAAQRQIPVPVEYDGISLESGFRIDLLVEDLVIVEIKAVEVMIPLYEAQLLTYLKLSGKQLGYLMNFNVARLKISLKRLVLTPPL